MSHHPDNPIIAAARGPRAVADDPSIDARYVQMCRAIDACCRVDEAKHIRDMALALEVYTRQAENREPERRAIEIRLRAERRAGELMLRQMKAEGTRAQLQGRDPSGAPVVRPLKDGVPTLAKQGISKSQASDWQKIAALDGATFEAALHDSDCMPSTASMVRLATAQPHVSVTAMDGSTTMNPLSLWVWDVVRSFERKDLAHQGPAAVFGGMTATMQADLVRLVPGLCDWFAQLPIEEVKQ